MRNTIKLKGDGRYEEAPAASAITPGQLIEQTNTGKVQRHSSKSTGGERLVAIEDPFQGRTIDDNYAADDIVRYEAVVPGQEMLMILEAGENVTIGADLQSEGNGNLSARESSNPIVAKAMEALDLSGSNAVSTRIRVRIAFAP